MSNDIQKFDPSQLMQGVRDRIKATFVSLIPDDQWESLCTREAELFFDPVKDYAQTNSRGVSSFSRICNEVLAELTKAQIIQFLAKYESTMWLNNELVVNDVLKDALIKNASELFSAMVGSRVQSVINEMKNRGY